MKSIKYKFNSKSLSYEQVKTTLADRLRRLFSHVATGLVFGVAGVIVAFNTVESPREKRLERELETMRLEYEMVNKRLDKMSSVLANLQERDDNIYRVVFEADPVPDDVRNAGFGGINRYDKYQGLDNSELISSMVKKADILSKKLVVQSQSFDEILGLVKNKSKMLSSIPAIQPVRNKDLRKMSSGYGYRTDPFSKVKIFHSGIDFTAPTGTQIYATADGVVARADADASGYGNHIRIDHGFGYLTLYAHLSKLKVKPGQNVKRGDLIGFVGSTGKSTGPHLHYEVHKDNKPINPINFFINDISPEDYEKLVRAAETENQSFD